MNEIISAEVKDLAWQMYDKINKIAKPVHVFADEVAPGIRVGYIKDNLSEEEELSMAKQVVDQVFTTIYDDLLTTGHTHIFWRVAPVWTWAPTAAWDEVYLRAHYSLFTPKEKEETTDNANN